MAGLLVFFVMLLTSGTLITVSRKTNSPIRVSITAKILQKFKVDSGAPDCIHSHKPKKILSYYIKCIFNRVKGSTGIYHQEALVRVYITKSDFMKKVEENGKTV